METSRVEKARTGSRDSLSLGLAVAGTICAVLPLVAPILLVLVRLVAGRRIVFDFLMPFELFPLVLAAMALLTWASLRGRLRRGLVLGSTAAGVGLVVAGSVLATVTGLASGEQDAEGWRLVLVGSAFGAALLALVVLAAAGVLLVRDLGVDLRSRRVPPEEGSRPGR